MRKSSVLRGVVTLDVLQACSNTTLFPLWQLGHVSPSIGDHYGLGVFIASGGNYLTFPASSALTFQIKITVFLRLTR